MYLCIGLIAYCFVSVGIGGVNRAYPVAAGHDRKKFVSICVNPWFSYPGMTGKTAEERPKYTGKAVKYAPNGRPLGEIYKSKKEI